ncbi:hypothetical protein [Frigidibacter sp. MR17.24]|uniref:hypothetical protein n=1 Tax=Frigidibacter sp. MR17.24 TaxID=3127345 RepID=UPI003012D116
MGALDDMPASPVMAFPVSSGEGEYWQEGMTLRDWFAGQALAGEMANSEVGVWSVGAADYSLLVRARLFYRFADAMLAAREAK